MPKKDLNGDLKKHTLLLYEGDFDRLNELYPDLTASVAIRHLIRTHLQKADQHVNARTPEIELG